jgi:hypothetical protein
MGLLMWNVKPYVFRNGNKCILNQIMGSNPFPTMGTKKKVGLYNI